MKDNGATLHTRSRYDFIAPVYNFLEWPIEKLFYKKWRRKLWEQVEGSQVLEIGVGTGKNLFHYPLRTNVTGIDLSPGMLDKAQKCLQKHPNPKVKLMEDDAQALSFNDEVFDAVVATFVFCSVPDPVMALREALRVTRPGGKLHLLEHMQSKKSPIAYLMKQLDRPIHYLTGVHIARQTEKNVKSAGWVIEETKDLTPGGIFRKIGASKPI